MTLNQSRVEPISEVDEDTLQQLAGKILQDVSGAFAVLLGFMGDQTGVYTALRDHGPCTSDELARIARVDARYLLEWLSAQAAAGYVSYDSENELFSLSPEQAVVLTEEGHPAFLQGLFQILTAQYTTHEKAIDVFRTGEGRPWGEHQGCCFCGTDRFFRPGYVANLTDSWLPALDGVIDKLLSGAKVADIGCGHGSSTILMAKAFPESLFVGYDFHAPSIGSAREAANQTAARKNTQFEVKSVKEIDETGFDLACIFDALHDMGDPIGAAAAIRRSLAPDGTLMLVEPRAGDNLSENLHLLGQIFYSASTLICTPASRAQEVGLALGAQAGFKRLTAVLRSAGFTRIRLATETDTNMVIEARP